MESSQSHRGVGTIKEISKHHCFGCCHVFYVFCLTRCTRKLEFLYHVPLRLGRTNGWNIFGCYWLVGDRKSTRLNSSHVRISYAVFCLKKKKIKKNTSSYV